MGAASSLRRAGDTSRGHVEPRYQPAIGVGNCAFHFGNRHRLGSMGVPGVACHQWARWLRLGHAGWSTDPSISRDAHRGLSGTTWSIVLVSRLDERVRFADGRIEWMSQPSERANSSLVTRFRLVGGLPVWTYELGEATIEKRVMMPRLQNTVLVHTR